MANFTPEGTAVIENGLRRRAAGGFNVSGDASPTPEGRENGAPVKRTQLAFTLEVPEDFARTGGVRNIFFQTLESGDEGSVTRTRRRIGVEVPAGTQDGDVLYVNADAAEEASFPNLCIYVRVMPGLPKPQAKKSATSQALPAGTKASAGGAQLSRVEPCGRSRALTLKISRSEAENGGRRRDMLVRSCICRVCGGTGSVGDRPCGKCRGGLVQKRERIAYDLPPGISSGMRFLLAGKGDEGLERNGDLILTFLIE